ncbi:MAG: hypothetical protein ING19_08555 [Azospirillum sp.]|nr:hypothetical protein [Azospirillum sp.]
MNDRDSDIPREILRNRTAFGAVIFDAPEEASGGWAAQPGKDPFRIQGTGDLVGDTLWWTNFDYKQYMNAGLGKNAWTRRSDFPKVDHRRTIMEWGMDDDSSYEEKAAFLSEIFDRIMRLSKTFGIESFTGDSLAADFATSLFTAKRNQIPSINAAEALRNTIQSWSSPTIPRLRGAENVILRRPRLGYAAKMLRCVYPCGPWSHLGDMQFGDHADRLEYLFSLGTPFFANISVRNIHREFSDTIAFGSSLGGRNEMRSWASSPELEVLREFAEIDVKNAWVSEKVESPTLPDRVSELLDSPLANSSWSIGVVAENLWRGVVMPRPSRDRDQGKTYSYRGAWIASLDRANTMTDAIELVKDGFCVTGYGGGQVHTAVLEGSHDELVKTAFRIGLHPTLAHSTPRNGRIVELPEFWGGAEADETCAILTTAGERDPLLAIDRAVFDPPARQLETFNAILSASGEDQNVDA